MQVEVTTPEEHMGDVIGDLNSRRGLVGEFLDKPGNQRVSTAALFADPDDYLLAYDLSLCLAPQSAHCHRLLIRTAWPNEAGLCHGKEGA